MTLWHFLQISQISPWKCWLQSTILVPACVTSDMWEVNDHVSSVNTLVNWKDEIDWHFILQIQGRNWYFAKFGDNFGCWWFTHWIIPKVAKYRVYQHTRFIDGSIWRKNKSKMNYMLVNWLFWQGMNELP